MDWQLQDAKNRLSEVVKRARIEGPQVLTVRGKRAAVILSAESYDALLASRPTIVDRLLAGPVWDDELVEAVNTREKAPSRPVAF
jgi:prevent-host-death family protein